MFTGGSQFAFIGVVAASGTGGAAVATAALLGARNGFYGLQMARILRPRGWRRIVTAHVTIDESTAGGSTQAAVRPDRPDLAPIGFWATAVAGFTLWNAAPPLGAVGGDALRGPRRHPARCRSGERTRRPAPLRPGRRGGRGVPGVAVAATRDGPHPARGPRGGRRRVGACPPAAPGSAGARRSGGRRGGRLARGGK